MFVKRGVQLEALEKVRVSQVGAAVRDRVRMVALDCRDARRARVASRSNECPVEGTAEHLQIQSTLSAIACHQVRLLAAVVLGLARPALCTFQSASAVTDIPKGLQACCGRLS